MERTDNLDIRRRSAKRLCRNILTYVVVCGFLALINYLTTPWHWWVLWIIAGWGLNIVLQLSFYLTGCEDEENE